MTNGSKNVILRATHLLTQCEILPDVQWLDLWPPFITRVINPHRELDSLDNVSQRVINEIITPILCELLTAMKERGGQPIPS